MGHGPCERGDRWAGRMDGDSLGSKNPPFPFLGVGKAEHQGPHAPLLAWIGEAARPRSARPSALSDTARPRGSPSFPPGWEPV